MDEILEQTTLEEIFQCLNIEDINMFREIYLSYHPFDLAQVFEELDEDQRQKLYNCLSPAEIAPIMEHIDVEDVIDYFDEMSAIYISQILEAMDVDDAVDILSQMTERNMVVSYLSIMKKENASEIRKLLQYEEKTAGSIMTTNFLALPDNYDVKQAMKKLISEANDAETIYTLYAIDDRSQLVGTLSLRELILARAGIRVNEIMNPKVISVSADMDQEDVAKIMRDYDFNALPVIDYQNHIIGIITIDDVVDVINEEANEDYERFAGVSDIEEIIEQNSWQNALSRLPWLILLLVLGMLNSNLLNMFEETLTTLVALSFFLPLIAGMAGNTGTQSLAITIRKVTTSNLSLKEKFHHVTKEAITGLIIGVVTSLVALLLIYLLQADWLVASLVAVSIFVSLIVATAAGALVPLIMIHFKIDPAVASGPFISTLNDLISMTIYLGLATYIIENYL